MILIIHQSLKSAKEAADIFYYMGIPAVAKRPKEALSEISLNYRAVLLCCPSALPSPEAYVESLRSYSGGVPIFALCEDEEDFSVSHLFDSYFKADSYSSQIFMRIRAYQAEHGLPLLGSYTLAGLCLDCDAKQASYCDKPIHFTKTEAMILRYLIRSYPESTDVHHVLRYAMRPGNLSEPSSIRTHIYGINKKFTEATGRRLISSLPGEGYRIVTPEMEAAMV